MNQIYLQAIPVTRSYEPTKFYEFSLLIKFFIENDLYLRLYSN